MKEDFLVDAWWTSRRLGLLRYPVLEDSSLQLIAPVTLSTVRRVSVGEDLDHADSLTLRVGVRSHSPCHLKKCLHFHPVLCPYSLSPFTYLFIKFVRSLEFITLNDFV